MMQYREYGKTGKRVSIVGFGGMRFDTTRSNEENAELLVHARRAGINYFDTAPGYCGDRSEDIFGLALPQLEAGFYVSTKGMPTDFDTADKARAAVEKSLACLHVPKIHFYHVWCLRKMEHYKLAMRPGGQYEGLLRCQQEGLIEHIAFSSHQPGEEVETILREGKMAGVLMGINILNFPYRWKGVQAAAATGCGVVAMNPLAGGLIPQNAAALAFLAGPGETPVEAALRFTLSCPEIAVSLVGFSCHDHIDTACRVAADCRPFAAADRARVTARLGANMNAVCTTCGYCEGCPQNIPVPSYMQFYNQKQMFGASDQEMRSRIPFEHDWGILAARQADASACVECGKCEEACTQRLNIIERLREIAGWETGAKP